MRLFEEAQTGTIGFPNLGIEDFELSNGFDLFGTGFVIKYYGVIIAFGLLLAVFYAMRRARQFGLTSDDILDIVLVGTPCGIIGARLYYVIYAGLPFSQWLNIRDGGLAIYGGVIGAVGSVVLFCMLSQKRRKKLLPCMDIAGIGFLIGQSIGRWGNFFNREAHGGETDSLFAMRILENGKIIQVHPTFLYESVWNLAGFILLHFLSKKRKFDGQIFLCYLAWYGLGRSFIEGMRTDSLMSGSLRISQVVAIVTCVVSVAIIAYILIRKRPNGENMLVHCAAAHTETNTDKEEES
ncbi:MAG: prolipoprotein diacylglyceryl transferase [Ruminococcaceae bacterium]|nr:prolipoprotein diacylglyceryl transferase [Oscillospiraceae bacterium]